MKYDGYKTDMIIPETVPNMQTSRRNKQNLSGMQFVGLAVDVENGAACLHDNDFEMLMPV
ncbi:hypothetical protein D3C76_1753070 [compost metagenome]